MAEFSVTAMCVMAQTVLGGFNYESSTEITVVRGRRVSTRKMDASEVFIAITINEEPQTRQPCAARLDTQPGGTIC